MTVRAAVRSYSRVKRRVRVTGASGRAAQVRLPLELKPGASAAVRARIVVKHPALWSPASPALYTVKVAAGTARMSFETGIRSIRIKRGRLYLRGTRCTCAVSAYPRTTRPAARR